LEAADGKKYLTDIADAEALLDIGLRFTNI
jgi:hypothetical protein